MKIIKNKLAWKIMKILFILIIFILLALSFFFQIPKIKVSSKYIYGSEVIPGNCISISICTKMGYSDQNSIIVGNIPYGFHDKPNSALIVQEDTFRWLGIGWEMVCYSPATADNELCIGFMNNLAKEECIIGEPCDTSKYRCSNNPCNPGQCCIESKFNSCKNLDELGSYKDYPKIQISFKTSDIDCFRD